jgi:hypothetical protein
VPSLNPKDVEASALNKPRLDLLEPAANEAAAAALANGADRYGVRNYRRSPISYRVYLAAMLRHIAALLRGEDYAPDSGVHHLGHLDANVHVVTGAIEAGTLVDDRRPEDEPQTTDLSSYVQAIDDFVRELAEEEGQRQAEEELAARADMGLPLPAELFEQAILEPVRTLDVPPVPESIDLAPCWDAPSEHRAAEAMRERVVVLREYPEPERIKVEPVTITLTIDGRDLGKWSPVREPQLDDSLGMGV